MRRVEEDFRQLGEKRGGIAGKLLPPRAQEEKAVMSKAFRIIDMLSAELRMMMLQD